MTLIKLLQGEAVALVDELRQLIGSNEQWSEVIVPVAADTEKFQTTTGIGLVEFPAPIIDISRFNLFGLMSGSRDAISSRQVVPGFLMGLITGCCHRISGLNPVSSGTISARQNPGALGWTRSSDLLVAKADYGNGDIRVTGW